MATDTRLVGERDGTPVLVVEDKPRARAMVRALLEEEGLPVETADDGREAVKRAMRSRPSLVVLDVGLSGLDADEVASALRLLHGEGLPIILISADAPGEGVHRVGAVARLTGPSGADAPLEAVWRRLGDSRLAQ